MDLVRSCYVTTMSFDLAGTLRAPVRWFFAAPDAEIFPGPHFYGTRNYQTCPDEAVGPGEVWNALRPWSNGKRPAKLTGKGPVCGNIAWFFTGVPSTAPRLQVDASGVPICCGVGGIGGLQVGAGTPQLCQPYYTSRPPLLEAAGVPFRLPDQYGPEEAQWVIDSSGPKIIEFMAEPFFNCRNIAHGAGGAYYTGGDPSQSGQFNLVAYYSDAQMGVWVPQNPVSWLPQGFVKLWFAFARLASGGIRIGGKTPLGLPVYKGYGGLQVGAKIINHEVGQGRGGLKLGAKSKLIWLRPGAGGLRPGGFSALSETYFYLTTGGVRPGATSTIRIILPGAPAGGLRPGGQGSPHHLYGATGGVRPGATLAIAKSYSAAGGLKPGATSKLRLHYTAAGGIKPGGTSNGYQGVYTSCCPGRVIPFTLYVTDTATSIKYAGTWNSAQSRWNFTGPSSLAFAVECTTLAGTLTFFALHIPPPTCVNSITGITHSCTGTTLCTHTLTLGGGSCGGLSGSHWQFKITTV